MQALIDERRRNAMRSVHQLCLERVASFDTLFVVGALERTILERRHVLDRANTGGTIVFHDLELGLGLGQRQVASMQC